MWCDLLLLNVERTWIDPPSPLYTEMQYRGWLYPMPPYMEIFMSHVMRWTMGQMRVLLYTLEIKAGRALGVRTCQQEVESAGALYMQMPIFDKIRGECSCLFTEGSGVLLRVMDHPDQQCLGIFLMEMHRHRERAL